MKQFSNKISLIKNNRGCYILDTIKGCSICKTSKPEGCYGDCYAKHIANRYAIDFSNPVHRDFPRDDEQLKLFSFHDSRHVSDIINAIKNIDMPFVRIGEMGDPSEDWEYTINVCKIIQEADKPIVIITKHWKPIPEKLLNEIDTLCINTSISALDSAAEIDYRLYQFKRLKPHCKSILRIVSCDFNESTAEGALRKCNQDMLFEQSPIIDTVFRPSAQNPFVTSGLINVQKIKFLKSHCLASLHDENIYLGRCDTCPDMCGINL